MAKSSPSASGRRDDEQALIARLDARYRSALASFFLKRLPQGEDVDDLVQEVFIKLARTELAGVDRIDGYIFTTAANVLRDRLRRRSARAGGRHDAFHEELHAPSDEISPERVLLGKVQLQRVIAALEELPERTRRIFLMRRYDGLPHAEIAAREGLSQSGVRKHIVKAVAHLAERMDS